MRSEHEWDDEVGACVRCGAQRRRELPKAGPIEDQPPASAADRVTRVGGPRGTRARQTDEQRVNFGIGPKRHVTPPVHLAPTVPAAALTLPPGNIEPAPDVATIPDPITAAIAELQLWSDEIGVAIDTLRRLHGRKSA
jgi:hypothetical protein